MDDCKDSGRRSSPSWKGWMGLNGIPDKMLVSILSHDGFMIKQCILGGRITQVHGKTEGLKKSEYKTLCNSCTIRKATRNRFIDAHLGRQLTLVSRSINRQVGIY